MQVKSVREAEVAGKQVLLRLDLNVPLQDGKVADDTRIKAALPTIKLLLERGAKIVVLTHLGRPGGKVVEALRVASVAKKLAELAGQEIEVLENLRFNPGEEANDPAFAQELARMGDLFVDDAFADAHRAHASIVGLPTLVPSYAGLLMEKEVAELTKALTPPKGALAILGGAKFETKIPLIEALLERYERVLLGGALSNDVVKARGLAVGASLVSSVPVPPVLATNERLMVPLDAVVRDKDHNAERTALIHDLRAQERVVDIGPATTALWQEEVEQAPFVLWNGPLGMFEDGYVRGTDAVAQALARSNVQAVVGGGDTIAAISKCSFNPAKVFISTGGGAMLEFLTRGTLPGLEALKK